MEAGRCFVSCTCVLNGPVLSDLFQCTTSSVKGPIAVLDPAAGSVPARITVYETLHDKYDDTMDAHRGVSLLLLDYLLVTSLLLVIDIQEASKSDGDVSRISSMTTPAAPSLAASPSQWRKIIFGEPLFPRRASNPAVIPPPLRPQLASQSSTQVNTVHSVLPQIRGSSIDISASMLLLESDTEADESDLEDPAPPSPSAESVATFITQPSAPAHVYLDPLFYAHDAPPVPPIPSQYASENVARVSVASTSSTSQRRVRILPQPPSVQRRSRSTPPPESPSPRPSQDSSSSESRPSQRPSRPVVRTSSISSTRRLPVPPTPTTPGASTESSLQTPTSALHPSLREKRVSMHGRRSLPPTPMSAPLSGGFLDSSRLKTSDAHDALLEWAGGSSRHSVLDLPPPAYSTIVSPGNPVPVNDSPLVSPQSAGV